MPKSKFFQTFLKYDEEISRKVVTRFKPIQKVLGFISLSGNSQPWIVLSTVFFIFNDFLTRIQNLSQVIVILLSASIVGIVKTIVKRERPNHLMVKEYIAKVDYYSFPSGHSTRAIVFSIMMTYYYPVFGWIFILWGLIIAFTRIALDLHYFFDVITGIILGIFGGVLGIFVYQKLVIVLSDYSFFT
ncbi:MAG: phosphatase PAP2 family protein [Candidatus Heimdallarchaeaceae archaeon]